MAIAFGTSEADRAKVQIPDFAALWEDYFSIPEERIKSLESVLTIVK
jgi:hypothetical protein